MNKIGLSLKIDVSKIDKNKLFKGEKGTYLDLTTFVDLANKDQYDNNGFITQSQTKEEREQGVQMPILGNVRVFYQDSANNGTNQRQQQSYQAQAPADAFEDSDVPF